MFQGRIEVMCGIFLDKNGGRTDWKRLLLKWHLMQWYYRNTVTDALGSVSKTTTNGTEQVLSIKDETSSGSIETTYEYDMNGQKIKETYGDGSYLTFTYDVYGNNVKKSSFNANGNEINSTEYVYDGDGNIIEAIGNKNGTPLSLIHISGSFFIWLWLEWCIWYVCIWNRW